MLKRLVIAILVSMFCAQLVGVDSAQAACTPSSSGSFSSGSSIVANRVVVCANSSGSSASTSTKAAPKVVATKPIAVSKPVAVVPVVCPKSVSTTAQIVAAALLGCAIPGPSLPPTKTPAAKPKTTSVISASLASDQAAFEANPISISASKASLEIGESVLLTTSAATHERSAVILGRVGYVQFVPVDYSWSDDSGWASSSPVAIDAFSSVGPKSISVFVSYSASYRFGLSEPWISAGTVTASAQTSLDVSAAPPPTPTRLVAHLVWGSCAIHVSSYRC